MRVAAIVLMVAGAAIFAGSLAWYVRKALERAPHPRVQSRASSVLDILATFEHGGITSRARAAAGAATAAGCAVFVAGLVLLDRGG